MGRDQLGIKVVNRISEHEGVDPIDLPPLYEEIDLETLELLFKNTSQHLYVGFNYLGYRISIDGEDTITITASHEEVTESSTISIMEEN